MWAQMGIYVLVFKRILQPCGVSLTQPLEIPSVYKGDMAPAAAAGWRASQDQGELSVRPPLSLSTLEHCHRGAETVKHTGPRKTKP